MPGAPGVLGGLGDDALVVDDEEAVALAVGMQAAIRGAIAGIEQAPVRALTEVVQVMPPRLRSRVDALRAVTVPAGWGSPGPAVDPASLIAVAQACRDTERLEFAYTSCSGEESGRHVGPHRLVALGRRRYILAHDLTRHDWRSLRLDRLARARTTGARFRTRELPAVDAAAFVRAGIEGVPAPYTVEVTVDAPAATVRERVGRWGTVEAQGAGRCLLRMTSDPLDRPTMAVGSPGAVFEVRSPPGFVDDVRGWNERFGRAAG